MEAHSVGGEAHSVDKEAHYEGRGLYLKVGMIILEADANPLVE